MWFLLKLFSLVVASLFMHNICKDKIDNYLLLSQQQSVYELPHISDAVVLNDESVLLIGHVINISEALVTSLLHHNSSVDCSPFRSGSYDNDIVHNGQWYVTDVYTPRVADEPSIQSFKTNDFTLYSNIHCSLFDVLINTTTTDHNELQEYINGTEETQDYINGTEETQDYIYQELKSYLPLYIYKELVNEYHVLSMEYQQRQQNDLSKPSWKQVSNIYINKIKLFTQQTNSLLWKLSLAKYKTIKSHIYGTKEAHEYIYQQLELYLPSIIYKELVNEYHVLSLEYQRRQQNDLMIPSWKQTSNIYLNKIKIFTSQTNLLLWKLSQHTVNCVKYTILSITDYLNRLCILIADYITSLYSLLVIAVHSIDLQPRDFLYLNIFLLVIYETKKRNQIQISQLAGNYENEITNMEILLKNTTSNYKQQIEEMEKTRIKDKLRSIKLVGEERNKYEKPFKIMNSRPPPPSFVQPRPPSSVQPQPPSFVQPRPPSFVQPRPPSFVQPQPPLFVQQRPPSFIQPLTHYQPLNGVIPTLRKDNMYVVPVLRKAVTPTQQLPSVTHSKQPRSALSTQHEKIDSLQFFGCPENYTRPSTRIN